MFNATTVSISGGFIYIFISTRLAFNAINIDGTEWEIIDDHEYEGVKISDEALGLPEINEMIQEENLKVSENIMSLGTIPQNRRCYPAVSMIGMKETVINWKTKVIWEGITSTDSNSDNESTCKECNNTATGIPTQCDKCDKRKKVYEVGYFNDRANKHLNLLY